MIDKLEDLADRLGVTWFDYQLDAFHAAEMDAERRRCLYYKTGAGKSITALVDMLIWSQDEVLVITPPATFPQWEAAGAAVGISVECMSHAKFRMPSTKISRLRAVIADEMHLFGGHGGAGWQKLARLSRGLQAPLVLASATPNYNDADRVYCIQHILDPVGTKGGFIEFVYRHCTTVQNPFGMMPMVVGFQRYPDAAAYLAALPGVDYLPDDLVYQIVDKAIPEQVPDSLEIYGINVRARRMIASQIEERHARVNLSLVDDDGKIRKHVYDELMSLVFTASTPVLVFAGHSTVADALGRSLAADGIKHAVVTGATRAKKKASHIADFIAGRHDVLVGTASLATGTDGLDKACDMLVILDDTEDASLRRQLIGRIMPRGADADASNKQVVRLLLQ